MWEKVIKESLIIKILKSLRIIKVRQFDSVDDIDSEKYVLNFMNPLAYIYLIVIIPVAVIRELFK